MADSSTVCSMCGDVGFSDKLFRCMRCLSRFQHSYCSNYYREEASWKSSATDVCDWCLSNERTDTPKKGSSHFKKSFKRSRNKKEIEVEEARNQPANGATSTKRAGRRYKLLKDILC